VAREQARTKGQTVPTHELSCRRDRQSGDEPARAGLGVAAAAPAVAAPTPVAGLVRTSTPVTEDPLGGSEIPAGLADTLRRRRGNGSPLPPDVAERFGEQLGADLSGVRVHADAEADQISRSVQATAFTHGTDVYFTQGSYAPHSQSGQHLLAHELAHVTQQDRGSGGLIGRADDPAEAAADATAARVVGALRRRATEPQEGGARAEAAQPRTDDVVRRFTTARPRRRPIIGGHRGAAPTPLLGGHRVGNQAPPQHERPPSAYSGEADGGNYNNEDEKFESESDGGNYNNEHEGRIEHGAWAYSGEADGSNYNNEDEKVETEAEGGNYNNEEEKFDSESDGGLYNNDNEFVPEGESPGQPGHAYGQKIDAPNYVDVDGLPETEGSETKSSESEQGEPNYVEPVTSSPQSDVPRQSNGPYYSETPSNGPTYSEVGDESKESEEPAYSDVHIEPERGRPQSGTTTSNAGNSRHHRAWVTSKLHKDYGDEEGNSNPHLVDAVEPQVRNVRCCYDALQVLGPHLNDPGPDGGKAVIAEALTKLTPSPGLLEAVKDLPFPKLVAMLRRQHYRFCEGLRRQGFPVKVNGDIDTPSGKIEMDERKVKYDNTAEEQEATHVSFKGGVLMRSDKAPVTGPVDTSDSVTHFSGPGFEIFVVSLDGEIHMASHKVGMYHHSSLLGGAEVALGGEMEVKNGKIVMMSNKSGHYLPDTSQLIQFLHFLEKDGIPLDFDVKGFDIKGVCKASELVAGRDKEGNADARKGYEARKLKAVWEGFADEYDEDDLEEAIEKNGWQGDERGVVDQQGQPVDPKVVRKYLKEYFGKKAPRKQRTRRSPRVSAKVKWKN
jgi:hypothetical protein